MLQDLKQNSCFHTLCLNSAEQPTSQSPLAASKKCVLPSVTWQRKSTRTQRNLALTNWQVCTLNRRTKTTSTQASFSINRTSNSLLSFILYSISSFFVNGALLQIAVYITLQFYLGSCEIVQSPKTCNPVSDPVQKLESGKTRNKSCYQHEWSQ